MKDIELIMENWRGFLKEEEEAIAAHSPYTLDTPDGIRKLINAYREAAPEVNKEWLKPENTGKVPAVTGIYAKKKNKKDVYKGNGDKYEAEVFNYFLEVPDLQPFRGDFDTPAGSDASRADLDFYLPHEDGRVGPIKVELKLNPVAQLGGSSIGIGLPEDNEEDKEGIELVGSVENPRLNLTLAKDSGFDAKAVKEIIYPVLVKKKDLLAKIPEFLQNALIGQYNKFFEEASTQIIVEQINNYRGRYSKEQLIQLKESLETTSEEEKAKILEKINQANQIFPLVTSAYAWGEVVRSGSLQGLSENIEEQKIQEFLIPHYENKKIHYIQIGNVEKYISEKDGKKPSSKQFLYGLYRIGDQDPYNLESVGVPSLEEVMEKHNIGYRLELRPGPAGSTKPEWCKKIVGGEGICKRPGVEDIGDAYKMRSVNYRVQGRFYVKKITEESLDNPSILEEIGDSATEEANGINKYTIAALQKLKNIGDAFLDEIKPEDTVPDEAATKEIEQNDQDNNQEQ
jgi:hypothetical protein